MKNFEPIELINTSTSTFFDNSKVPCKEHTSQPIINFCLNSQCMVGLCSNCICTHTQMHVKTQTAPYYQSIKELKTNVIQELNQYLKMYGDCKDRISATSISLDTLKQEIKETLIQAKQDVYDVVDQTFEVLSVKFLEEIERRRKAAGVLSVCDLEMLSKKVSKKMRDMVEEGQQLNSMMRFIESVRKLKLQGFADSKFFLKSVDSEIYNSEMFNSELKYSKELISNLGAQIQKIFTIEFKYGNIPNRPRSLSKQQTEMNLRKSTVLQNQSAVYPVIRPSSCSKPSLQRQTSLAYPFQTITNTIKPQTPTYFTENSRLLSNMTNSVTYGSKFLKLDSQNNKNLRSSQMSSKIGGLRLSSSFTSSQMKDFLRAQKESQK